MLAACPFPRSPATASTNCWRPSTRPSRSTPLCAPLFAFQPETELPWLCCTSSGRCLRRVTTASFANWRPKSQSPCNGAWMGASENPQILWKRLWERAPLDSLKCRNKGTYDELNHTAAGGCKYLLGNGLSD